MSESEFDSAVAYVICVQEVVGLSPGRGVIKLSGNGKWLELTISQTFIISLKVLTTRMSLKFKVGKLSHI